MPQKVRNKTMKRIIILTAVILLVFTGCTKSKNPHENTTVAQQITEASSRIITATSTEESTESAEESSVTATNTTVSIPTATVITTEGTTVTKPALTSTTAVITEASTTTHTTVPTTAVQTTQKPTQATTQPQAENPGLNAVAPATTKAVPATTEDKKITVTVFCSCKNAVNYGIRNQGDYGNFIPESGILIDTTVNVAPDSTAMDAIKAACRQNGIEIDESRGYIKGIGGLYEKDCGGASGWLYSVNDSFPYTSSDKYVLKPNDRIELHYTVKNGDVTRM